MHKLLLICLCFKLADFSVTMNEEKQVVKDYVQRIIETQIPSEATVFYAYNTTNDYLADNITNPKIITDLTKKILNTDVYESYNEMFIVELKNISFIASCMDVLQNKRLTKLESSTRRKYLLIVPDLHTNVVKLIFTVFFGFDVTNLIILTFNSTSISDTITVFTYDAYAAENQCGKFGEVVQHYNYSTIKYIKKPRLLDKYKNCTVVRMIENSYGERNVRLNKLFYLVHFVIHSISKTLNLKIKVEVAGKTSTRRKENVIGSTYYRFCRTAEKSCSFPFTKVDWIWVIPPPDQLNLLEVFGVIFKKVVWISIALTFILTSIVWWLLSKCIRVSSFTSALMDLYSITLFGSVNKVPSFFQLRILFIAYIIYIIPIQTIVTSSLIRLLTVPQYGHSIKTVEEIVTSEFPIMIAPDTMSSLFDHTEDNHTLYSKLKNKLVKINGSPADAMLKMIKHKNGISIMLLYQARLIELFIGAKLPFFVDDSLFSSEPFAVILIEAGLLNYQENIYKLRVKNYTAERADSEDKVVLSLSHIYPIFVFWAIGISFAASVFFIELLTYYYYK
ncbi:hypothetical protein FQA39_LY17725 [Lamprigera yunnana]|nr:hypothetical protein FQA39_LY17725 [Lamprigera yunnana]